jgi:hypothetical protein
MRWTRGVVARFMRVDERRRSPAKPLGEDGRSRTAKSCGPDASTLASSSLEASASQGRWWQESPITRESTKETVKPLRREGRTASAEPVCSCAHFLCASLHTRPRVQRTPGLPCPSLEVACALLLEGRAASSAIWGRTILKTRTKAVARMRTRISSSPRSRGPIRRVLSFLQGSRCLPSQPTSGVMDPPFREDDGG